jgi:hypothetical protein
MPSEPRNAADGGDGDKLDARPDVAIRTGGKNHGTGVCLGKRWKEGKGWSKLAAVRLACWLCR